MNCGILRKEKAVHDVHGEEEAVEDIRGTDSTEPILCGKFRYQTAVEKQKSVKVASGLKG